MSKPNKKTFKPNQSGTFDMKRWQATTDSGQKFAGWAPDPVTFVGWVANAVANGFSTRSTHEIFIENMDDLTESYEFDAREYASEVLLERQTKFYCRFDEGHGIVYHCETAKIAALKCMMHFNDQGKLNNGVVLVNLGGSAHDAIENERECIPINVGRMLEDASEGRI